MKNLLFRTSMIAVLGLIVMSCSNSDTESRIARLEGRVAELEGRSGGTRTTATAPSASASSNTQAEVKPTGPIPEFTFGQEDHDFGKISEGDVVEHSFQFTNTGDAPLIISSAVGSCGCTVPEWPKEPVGIGETGEILVKFNSRKKPGLQNKTVTITANTYPKQTKLKIKANVTPAASDANPS